ncbi:hypothetical protein OH492_18910 [Vibrio chagasii]|nr:hypothetical protein [Vibrio chagasii]
MNVGFASITKLGSKSLQAWSTYGAAYLITLCLSLLFINSNQLPYIASYVINFDCLFFIDSVVMTALPIYYPSAFVPMKGCLVMVGNY